MECQNQALCTKQRIHIKGIANYNHPIKSAILNHAIKSTILHKYKVLLTVTVNSCPN